MRMTVRRQICEILCPGPWVKYQPVSTSQDERTASSMSEGYPVLIEFFGPPGVGKSTIANELATILHGQNVPTDNVTYHLSHEIGRWRSHAYKAPKVLVSACKFNIPRPATQPKNNPVATIRTIYNWLFIAHEYRRHFDQGVRLFDQGIIQAAWSVAYLAGEKDFKQAVSNGFELVPKKCEYIAVSVTADQDEIWTRLRNRSIGTQPDKLIEKKDELSRSLASFESLAKIVEAKTESSDHQHLYRISNSDDRTASGCAEELWEDAEQLIG